MPTKYAIRIVNDNLDLIMALNGSVRPYPENDKSFFVVTLPDLSNEFYAEIKSEDELYDENGLAKEELTFIG